LILKSSFFIVLLQLRKYRYFVMKEVATFIIGIEQSVEEDEREEERRREEGVKERKRRENKVKRRKRKRREIFNE
jgi:hypothetical protein